MSDSTTENNVVDSTLNYEKVWAMFQETDRILTQRFQEAERILTQEFQETVQMQKENARLIRELREDMKETDRRMEETDRQMKETDKRIGELGNRFGELAEHLVAPNIMEKFNERGFTFTRSSQNCKIKEYDDPKVKAEIDILLENGDIVIAVEVKSKPKQADIDAHVGRMEVLRRAADRQSDKRKFQGAIAGAIMNDAVRDYAFNSGFYVIEQTGDTVRINTPEDFMPREW